MTDVLQRLHKRLIWSIPENEPAVYLTFDDGPVPGVTPWVLKTLERWNAPATFFAVGDNVKKYPGLHQSVLDAGHHYGNHTFNHLPGWGVGARAYARNAALANEYLHSSLFRPPHGKITPGQIAILQRHYHIIMWTVLTGDFHNQKQAGQLVKNAILKTRPGAIVVFHDSVKAWKNMSTILPLYLRLLSESGFTFKAIDKKALEKFYARYYPVPGKISLHR